MKIVKSISLIIIILAILFYSCEKDEVELYPCCDFISEGQWEGEYWPTNGWRTCKPEEVGMDSKKLAELNEEVQTLLELHVDVHNILIVKDGYIVAEQYYSDEYGRDNLHSIHSCTKSITSALTGIAIKHGYIADLNQKMVDFFSEYEIENLTEEKQQITLKHLLTMSAGLEWYELEFLYSDERNTFRDFADSDNRVKFVLDRPMLSIPGEEYSYNTGISHVLSAILQKSIGTRLDSFAVKNLFKPLGINDYYWPYDAHGVSYGGNGMRLTSRDMAKFGYLYLKNGVWGNRQIVPEYWVQASQQKHVKRKYISDNFYGYHWWVSNQNSYSAVGFAGQWISIFPQQNLVVVFNNQFKEGDDFQWNTPQRLVHTYILPAIK